MKKKELLKEIMGVPKALNFWVDYFSIILAGMAKSISQSDEMEEAEVTYKNPNNPEEIVEDLANRGYKTMDGKTVMDWVQKIGGYSDLGQLIKNPTYKEFPLYKPTIGLMVTFVPDELYESEISGDYTKSIHAYHIWDPNTIKLSKMGGDNFVFLGQSFNFEVMVPFSWIENFDTDQFRKMLKPVIGHELTHAYETYKRFLGTGDPLKGRETFLNVASETAKKSDNPYWGKFLYLIYLSLSYEINARIVELYSFIKNNDIKNQEEFMNVLQKSSIWDKIKKLQSFNAENYINNFSDDEIKSLIDNWDKTLQDLNIEMTNKLGHIYKGKLMDKVPQSAKENPIKFFKFFEKIFHKKGEDFRRKALRLSSLLINGEQEKIVK
ncbi:MAG: hypothetical protein ACK5OW_00135 [bacterium]